ncbi:hypothetical protein BRAO375_4770020 [Bradyrhizobium sp. ORS 375]|nr:hypothetical protein BRAO375_4770020 [Bradyrhizobium sp. ORS 375]
MAGLSDDQKDAMRLNRSRILDQLAIAVRQINIASRDIGGCTHSTLTHVKTTIRN